AWAPGIADAAGDRAEPALVVGVGKSAGKDRADIAGQPAVLAFNPDDPVRVELPVVTCLHASEETAVAVVAGPKAGEIAVARERAAKVTTDIEAGPCEDLRWGRVVGPVAVGGRRARTQIGGANRQRRAEDGDCQRGRQNLVHG